MRLESLDVQGLETGVVSGALCRVSCREHSDEVVDLRTDRFETCDMILEKSYGIIVIQEGRIKRL